MRWAISLEEAQEDCVPLSDCTNGCLLFQKTASIRFADSQERTGFISKLMPHEEVVEHVSVV